MLAEALRGILKSHLGQYLDIDDLELGVGLWDGVVVLNNVKLKENALSDVGLAVRYTKVSISSQDFFQY